ncbi:hypothetical protein [Dysgonomonas termitidis]|uniref:Nucleotidyl transferase AbiEii/AbiGii toxin family protein n=1 Tax=Dysgonomonas termitidis TaxID=1516126 RepID=A0ABV9KZK1_9BACT
MANNIELIQCVAGGLGLLKDEVVFVGGSVAELYAQQPELSDIRPTIDVDCVVEISTYSAYYKLEEKLRLLGFHDDTTAGAPVCRKIYKGVKVDIMPVNPDILGFSNEWYADGIQYKIERVLPDGTSIFIFPVEYYIATKFEALNSRGGTDIRSSHDWEDIVYVMTNCPAMLSRIKQSDNTKLTEYLKEQYLRLLKNANIREIIYSSLPYHSEEESIDDVLDLIYKIVN